MDDDLALPRPVRAALGLALAAAVAVVAVLTLVPTGRGWSWGSPVEELRWYVTGLGSEATMVQLVGNLSLLVVPAALAVLLWPALGRVVRLLPLALAAAATIEFLQWTLPLGRVVSPLDAALNAAGAVGAGLLVAAATRLRAHVGASRPL
jgi:VanZ like family